jgi:hypothetical protein
VSRAGFFDTPAANTPLSKTPAQPNAKSKTATAAAQPGANSKPAAAAAAEAFIPSVKKWAHPRARRCGDCMGSPPRTSCAGTQWALPTHASAPGLLQLTSPTSAPGLRGLTPCPHRRRDRNGLTPRRLCWFACSRSSPAGRPVTFSGRARRVSGTTATPSRCGLHGSTQSTPPEYRGPAASCRQRSSDADGRSPSSSFFGSTELAPANRVPKAPE